MNTEPKFDEKEHLVAMALYDHTSMVYGFHISWADIGDARRKLYLQQARVAIQAYQNAIKQRYPGHWRGRTNDMKTAETKRQKYIRLLYEAHDAHLAVDLFDLVSENPDSRGAFEFMVEAAKKADEELIKHIRENVDL